MHQALIIYIIFQSLLFSVVLISGRKPENKPLAFYFGYLFLFHLFFMFSNEHFSINFSDVKFINVSYEFIALCNSAVVFSFLYSILEKPIPKPLYLLWLLPVLHTAASYVFKTVDPEFYAAGFYKNWYLNFPFYTKIIFTILLIWQITVFKKEISENSSSKKHHQLIKLYWGKYFVYFNLILSSLLLIYLVFTLANGRLYQLGSSSLTYSPYYYNMINRACTALFLLIFGYLALRNPVVFNAPSAGSHLEQQIAEIVLPEEEKNFQPKIEFGEEQIKHYMQVVNKLMDEDKIYLDPELSLSKLAARSKIPSRQLSQFILVTFHKNFKEYINSYRTLYAQQLLIQQNAVRYTMQAIAFDSGFNSESSFYKIFKQQTTLTPKQYQEKFKLNDLS
jgi:AraC-like DNA-binding protein